MSGYTGQGKRYGAGKMKNTNVGSRSEWKPKTKIATDESLDSASSGQKPDSSLPGDRALSDSKPCLNVKKEEESPLPNVKDVSSGMEKLNLVPNSCQKADNDSKQLKTVSTYADSSKDSHKVSSSFSSGIKISEKGKQFSDISQEKGDSSEKLDHGNHASSFKPFDICPKKVDTVVKLKVPLHVKNKERRNQLKRSNEGQDIIILRPGMVLMKSYITPEEQISIVKTCRDLGIGEGGFYKPGYRDGGKLHLMMMCLGKNWDPEKSEYGDVRLFDDSKPPGIPDKFHEKVKMAIVDSNAHIQKTNTKDKCIPSMLPDLCIVNFYTKSGKLGLHQDKDESSESLKKGLPVVSFSIGDSAEFLYGDERDIEKAEKVILESGDVLIFGGKSRHIFHGVTCINPDTAPAPAPSWLREETNLIAGRLNLTFRKF